jgi:AcrR family transcriptional regulator
VSRPTRTPRPSREETQRRLLDAAATVFVKQGISGASVEDIAEAAGFSRGAVYSNFADKDALVLALIDRMTDENIEEIEGTLAKHPDPESYIRSYQLLFASPDRRGGRHHPVLNTELVLYAMRNPAARPLLRKRLNRAEAAIHHVIETHAESLGLAPAGNRQAIASMILAMDDGFGLHALIDPKRDPVAAFSAALDFLAEAGAAIASVEHNAPTAARRRR